MQTRPLTITEQARRAQLVEVTINSISRYGYAGTSLARIAEAAGLSKAAVLYHFPSKDAVVRAAYDTVIGQLTEHIGTAVEAASGVAAVEAYIRALTGHLARHPDHTRMIVEAIGDAPTVDDTPAAPGRRESVAALIAAARDTGDYRADVDPTLTAIMMNGALDAIVSQQLTDPSFDTAAAAEHLIDMLRRALG